MFNKQLRVFVGCFLLMLAGGLMAKQSLADEPSLVLPTYLHHIQYQEKQELNEGFFANNALGLEWENDGTATSVVFVQSNSYERVSLYAYHLWYKKPHKDWRLGLGLVGAMGGYDVPFILSPMVAVKYKWVQVSTTAPAAKVINSPADLVNVQLIIPLGK